MRQVQITTEAGVGILLMTMMIAILLIIFQQNKFGKTLDEINDSVHKTQEALNEKGNLNKSTFTNSTNAEE